MSQDKQKTGCSEHFIAGWINAHCIEMVPYTAWNEAIWKILQRENWDPVYPGWQMKNWRIKQIWWHDQKSFRSIRIYGDRILWGNDSNQRGQTSIHAIIILYSLILKLWEHSEQDCEGVLWADPERTGFYPEGCSGRVKVNGFVLLYSVMHCFW